MKAASISPRRKNLRINSDNSMGLAKRIIPCLDVDKGRVCKGVKVVGIRDAGEPVEIARRYDEQGADEPVFLDITASHEGRDTMVHVVEEVAGQVFIPLTVGALFIVAPRNLHRIAGVANADELHAFDDAAFVDVEAGNEAYGEAHTIVRVDPQVFAPRRDRGRLHTISGRLPRPSRPRPLLRTICGWRPGSLRRRRRSPVW